jgi:mono/diheme cytochrome c family protein
MRTTIIGLAVLAGCSGSAMTSIDTTDTTQNDIVTFENLASRTQSAAASYRASMSTLDLTPATCTNLRDQYDGQVRPWISQMVQMSREMDQLITTHGGTVQADTSCVSSAMLAELDRHRDAACTSGEVVQHTTAMSAYAADVVERSGEMLDGLATHVFEWGAPMDGCGTLDPSVALGQRIFQQGNATTPACAACHGAGGHGGAMVAFAAPDVTYAGLVGRGYDDALISRAVASGIDASGQPLSIWMPRVALTAEEQSALLAYLKTLP